MSNSKPWCSSSTPDTTWSARTFYILEWKRQLKMTSCSVPDARLDAQHAIVRIVEWLLITENNGRVRGFLSEAPDMAIWIREYFNWKSSHSRTMRGDFVINNHTVKLGWLHASFFRASIKVPLLALLRASISKRIIGNSCDLNIYYS